MTTLTLLVLSLTSGQGPRVDQVLKWNEAALELIRVERTPPPAAARNLAIMHLAIYDAVNAVARTHQAYLVSALPEWEASADAAAAAAGHRTLVALYPRQRERLDRILARCVAELPA